MKSKSKIQIIFYLESLNFKTYRPVIYFFYLKTNSKTIFFKKIEINKEELVKSNSSNIFDHVEKNWNLYEQILYYNQYICKTDDINKTFDLYSFTHDDDIDVSLKEKKQELLILVRKHKIKNILK